MRSYIHNLRHQNKLYTILTVAVLAAALFFVYRIIYAGIIALPYPKEILEPSNIALTNEFLAGNSPYTATSLTRSIPGINYDYPPLCSLIAAGIAKITGCSAVTAHFAISLFAILASGVIGFTTVLNCIEDRRGDDTGKAEGSAGEKAVSTTVAPVFAALIFMFCHFRYGYISAAPDDLGLLLVLLTSAAAVSSKVKNKPLVCAVGITLCFYTKQYFVFVAAGLFIYMLTYSRREAIKLFLWTLMLNIAIGAVVTAFWPLYWTKAFFFTYLGTAVGGGGQISTLIDQFVYLLTIFGPLFAVIVAAVVHSLRHKSLVRNSASAESAFGAQERGKNRENDAFTMSVVQTIVMMAPLFVIARNDGAFLSYFLQLWMPYITIVALVSMERLRPVPHPGQYRTWRLLIHISIYTAIAVFTIYFGFARLPLHVLTEEETANWQKAMKYVEKYSGQGEVFYARSLAYAPEGLDPEGGDCICGHDGEVSTDTVAALTNAGLSDELIRYARQIVDQNLRYREEITDKAAGHKYSLITFDNSGAYTPFDEELCEDNGYRCIDRLDLQLGNMPYEVLFYALK